MRTHVFCGAIMLATCGIGVSSAIAQVEFYVNESRINDPLGTATFDGMQTFDPLQDYREAGMRIHINNFAFRFTPCGFPNGDMYYPNGGTLEQINITREDGEDFGAIEMNVSHGFANCVIYMWVQAYLDGSPVSEFDADVDGGDLIGMSGQFDEVRIASYNTPGERDAHNPTGHNAIALDNVSYGDGGGVFGLSVSGSCPGSMTFDVSGATPGGTVAYIYAFGAGNVTIPSGPCAGTELGLNGTARLGGTETANGAGEASLTTNVPGAACGRVFVQALDVSSCAPSNVEAL